MLEVPKIYGLSKSELSLFSELTDELDRFTSKYGDDITYNTEIAGGVEIIIPVCFRFQYYIILEKFDVIKRLEKLHVPMPETIKPSMAFLQTKFLHHSFQVFMFSDSVIGIDGLCFRSGADCARYMEAVTLSELFYNNANIAHAQAMAREKGEVYTE